MQEGAPPRKIDAAFRRDKMAFKGDPRGASVAI